MARSRSGAPLSPPPRQRADAQRAAGCGRRSCWSRSARRCRSSARRRSTARKPSSLRSGATLTSSGRGATPRSAPRRRLSACSASSSGASCASRLQVAQPRRVRRADVDDDVVGAVEERRQAGAIVVDGALERRDARLAEIDAERNGRPMQAQALAQIARHRGGAVIVEAQPVDQRRARPASERGAAAGCPAAPPR